jgi:uncharacterized protein YuzE
MAPLTKAHSRRYSRSAMRMHYDPEVDIALIVLEPGAAASEEHPWGLIDRDPEDGHLMGFEIWEASNHLPPELIAALPSPANTSDAA